jgi:hypothetical protein
MWAAIFVLGMVGIFNTDSMQSFRENSNHNPVYELVRAVPCDTGMKASG